MRRIGSALVVGLLVAACGGTSSDGDAGDAASSSSVAEPTTAVEATTTTVTDEPTTAVEATTPTVTDQPTAHTSENGEWVEVAVNEPWVGSVVELAALPGGGYVAVVGVPEEVEAAERAGSSLSTVMWSPDGVDWFEGDPQREIEPPGWFDSAHPLAVTSDRVVVVGGTDFSDHVPLAIGDPRTGSWDVVSLEYAALDGRSAGVSTVNLSASDDEVLVAAYSVPDDAAEMIDVVTWVVDPATGASTSNSFAVGARLWETNAPLAAWVDGHWILIEDMPGREQPNALWTSSDGLAWSQADLPDSMGGAIWLAAGQQGVAASNCTGMGGYGDAHDAYWFSTDGLEWTTVTYGDHPAPLTAVGEYGFVLRKDSGLLQLLAVDGSEVYHLATPFLATPVGATDGAASSGDTLLVLAQIGADPGLWLYSDAVT